jgi:hypothetical protein
MDKIYNKNAREKALLEEAYGSVYKEGVNLGDTSGGAQRRLADHNQQLKKSGAVRLELRGPKGTSRATLPKGDPKIEELEAQGYKRVPIEDEQNPNAGEYGPHGEGERPGPEEELNPYIEEEDVSTKFQPGQFVDVLGDDRKFSHQEVVLNVTGDVVTAIRTEGDGKPYGDTSRGYHDINLISPQDPNAGKYSAEPTLLPGQQY